MIQSFRRWVRVVLISDWVLWMMVGTVLATWLLQRLLVLWFYLFAASDLTDAERRLVSAPIHAIFVLFLAFFYGIGRVAAFHPLLNKPYGRWLATTPWMYPNSLPLGPLQLVRQDAVVLGILLALSLLPPWDNPLLIAAVPLAFLAGYCTALATALFQLERYRAGVVYAVLFGCGLLAISFPPAFVLVALAMLGVSSMAIGALRNFPYTPARREALGLAGSEKVVPAEIYLTITPQADDSTLELMNPTRAAIIGLTAGWLMFCVATLPISELTVRGLLLIHFGVCLVVILARLTIYSIRRMPPISLPGRIATGNYLIPGYDRVFIAPLAAAAATFLLPALLLALEIWPALTVAISTSTAMWLALALPPSFKEWYYTGHFRMLAPTGNQQKQPRVRAGN